MKTQTLRALALFLFVGMGLSACLQAGPTSTVQDAQDEEAIEEDTRTGLEPLAPPTSGTRTGPSTSGDVRLPPSHTPTQGPAPSTDPDDDSGDEPEPTGWGEHGPFNNEDYDIERQCSVYIKFGDPSQGTGTYGCNVIIERTWINNYGGGAVTEMWNSINRKGLTLYGVCNRQSPSFDLGRCKGEALQYLRYKMNHEARPGVEKAISERSKPIFDYHGDGRGVDRSKVRFHLLEITDQEWNAYWPYMSNRIQDPNYKRPNQNMCNSIHPRDGDYSVGFGNHRNWQCQRIQ